MIGSNYVCQTHARRHHDVLSFQCRSWYEFYGIDVLRIACAFSGHNHSANEKVWTSCRFVLFFLVRASQRESVKVFT